MSDTPKLPVLAFGAALSLPAAAGSLYLGALLFARWLSLQSAPSLLMLPHYWQHYAALPDKMRLPRYFPNRSASCTVQRALPTVRKSPKQGC